MVKRFVIGILMFVLLSTSVAGVGVTPSKTYVDFQPNHTIVGSCNQITDPGCVCVSEAGNGTAKFSVNGDIAEAVNTSTFRLAYSKRNFDCYTYNITFPYEAKKGGSNVLKVVATELASGNDGAFKVFINVDQKLIINVDEKYVAEYIPPPLDISKILLYSSIFAIATLIVILIIKGRR